MNGSYDNTVLDAIAKQLNSGIFDVKPVTIIIFSIVILIIAITLTAGIRGRIRTLKAAEASYQSLLRKFNLTIREIDFIDELASTMRKKEEKYHLLKNRSSYRAALRKLGELDEDQTALDSQLKIKLGYAEDDSAGRSLSTRDLPQYMPVFIATENRKSLEAEIYSQAISNVTIKCPEQKEPIVTDENLRIFAPYEGRLSVFTLTVDKVKSELFSASHSDAETVSKMNTEIEISGEKAVGEISESFKSLIVHITDKAFFITDQYNKLEPGDSLTLYLKNDHKRNFAMKAEVEKTSPEKGLALLRFTSRKHSGIDQDA